MLDTPEVSRIVHGPLVFPINLVASLVTTTELRDSDA